MGGHDHGEKWSIGKDRGVKSRPAQQVAGIVHRLLDMIEAGAIAADTPQARRTLRRFEGMISIMEASTAGLAYTKRPIGILGDVRVVGYMRCSTGEQADSGLGMEAQRKAIQDACTARGWSMSELCEDAAASGKNLRRAGMEKALAILDGGGADALVVSKLDRLSRSLLDFTALMERSRKNGWALVALDLGVDTTTPAGEMIANSVANFSQFERRLIGQRTREALAVRKAQGARLGRPRTLPDDVVRRIKSMRKGGETLNAIAESLNVDGVATAQGGRRWYPATVRKVLIGNSRPGE
jgi:DNA invertase Pin-like site-specific DNA recombinase